MDKKSFKAWFDFKHQTPEQKKKFMMAVVIVVMAGVLLTWALNISKFVDRNNWSLTGGGKNISLQELRTRLDETMDEMTAKFTELSEKAKAEAAIKNSTTTTSTSAQLKDIADSLEAQITASSSQEIATSTTSSLEVVIEQEEQIKERLRQLEGRLPN